MTKFPTCSNITNIADVKKRAAHPMMSVELEAENPQKATLISFNSELLLEHQTMEKVMITFLKRWLQLQRTTNKHL